jgi:hypothetical protein
VASPPPVSASNERPRAGLQPTSPRADRTAALQRGRGCRPEAAPPPGGRAAPHSGSLSAAEGRREAEKAPVAAGQNRAQQRSRTVPLEERPGALQPGLRRLRGANRAPRARWGVRASSWHRARSARGFYQLVGCAAGRRTSPRGPAPASGQPRRGRTDSPLPPYSPRRRAQIAPPCFNEAGAAAPRPRRGRAAVRGPRRAPLGVDESATQAAENGQNRPKRAPKWLGQKPQRTA